MNRYENSPTWLRFRQLLRDSFRIEICHQPTEIWRSIRGHYVHIDEWTPDSRPIGTVILVHGGGGNGRILAAYGDMVAALGWRALAPDLPGYGITKPSSDFRWEYDEWPAVVTELADNTEGPVVLMGLSMGGLTAALAAEASRKVAGVIATTLVDMSDRHIFMHAARWRWLAALSLIGFRYIPTILDRLALPVWLAAPMRKMTSDPAMQIYFQSDELLGSKLVPTRFFRTLSAHKLIRIEPGCPLLLVHPGADSWTPTSLSRVAFDKVADPKRMTELSNGSHLPLEQPAVEELRIEISKFLQSVQSSNL